MMKKIFFASLLIVMLCETAFASAGNIEYEVNELALRDTGEISLDVVDAKTKELIRLRRRPIINTAKGAVNSFKVWLPGNTLLVIPDGVKILYTDPLFASDPLGKVVPVDRGDGKKHLSFYPGETVFFGPQTSNAEWAFTVFFEDYSNYFQ